MQANDKKWISIQSFQKQPQIKRPKPNTMNEPLTFMFGSYLQDIAVLMGYFLHFILIKLPTIPV